MVPAKRQRDVKAGFGGALADRLGRGPDSASLSRCLGCAPRVGYPRDHSTFSKNRHGRFRESALFRYLFEDVVVRCVQAGLVRGEGLAIDASVIEADASRGRKVDGKPKACQKRRR
jgi:hypothetical protein